MQTSKFRPIFVLTSVNKNLIRSVTATATTEKVEVNETTPLKSWREIPGPSSLPIIGPMHHFFQGGLLHNLNGLELTTKLYETYGPIVRLDALVGVEPLIFLFDAESVSQVLHGENWLPVRPGFQTLEHYRQNIKKDTKKGNPTGLITDQGVQWKKLRSMVNPVMLHTKTIKLYKNAIDEVAMEMVARMKSRRDEKNMLNCKFDDEMNLWSLETMGVVALGCRLGCLDPNLQEDSPAKKLIECVHEIFVLADKLDFKPSIWKFISTPNFKKAMARYEEQETLSKHFIEKAMQEFKTKNKSDDEKGILEKLLEIDEELAHIMASDMLFAGVDTAANTMTGTMYLLAMNPEKQKKLREELRSNQENKPYLKACLKESMRMMPITSGNMRQTTKEYNLMGYKIPQNMRIAFCHHDMSLMEEHFFRSKEFIPERWLVEKDDPLHYKHAHPFAHSVFGFGVRSCIGRRIAELEMEIFTARLVENFQIEWFGPPPKIRQSAINYVQGPFNFIFKDAPK